MVVGFALLIDLYPFAHLDELSVLPEHGRRGIGSLLLFADDSDRLARFEREAQVLASLNHPNIGAIYGIEEAEGTRALVLSASDHTQGHPHGQYPSRNVGPGERGPSRRAVPPAAIPSRPAQTGPPVERRR